MYRKKMVPTVVLCFGLLLVWCIERFLGNISMLVVIIWSKMLLYLLFLMLLYRLFLMLLYRLFLAIFGLNRHFFVTHVVPTNWKSASLHYNISVLLLLCGDISINPGPTKYPCTVCLKSVKAVLCDSCQLWHCVI